jgi:hypothetical protein
MMRISVITADGMSTSGYCERGRELATTGPPCLTRFLGSSEYSAKG